MLSSLKIYLSILSIGVNIITVNTSSITIGLIIYMIEAESIFKKIVYHVEHEMKYNRCSHSKVEISEEIKLIHVFPTSCQEKSL